MDPTPESTPPPPPAVEEVAFDGARASPTVTLLWIIVVTFGVTPSVIITMTYLLGTAKANSTILVAGMLISVVVMLLVLFLGLNRNWQSRKSGWVLISVALVVGAAIGRLGYLSVQNSSVDKSALCNVRQLSAAADQYFLEYGVTSVDIKQLVGPTNYMKALNPVANESYPEIFVKDRTITVSGIAGLRTITYAP